MSTSKMNKFVLCYAIPFFAKKEEFKGNAFLIMKKGTGPVIRSSFFRGTAKVSPGGSSICNYFELSISLVCLLRGCFSGQRVKRYFLRPKTLNAHIL